MNTKKIILISLVILTMINIVFLPSSYAVKIDDIFNAGDDFLKSGDEPETVLDTDKLEKTSTVVYKILLTIAICVSVLVGAVLGIQFILGSVEGKVKVQEALVPYIVGCFVVFGAFTIWGIAIKTGDSITEQSSGTPDSTYSTPGVCSTCGKQLCESYVQNEKEGKLELYCDSCNKKVTIKPYGM